MGRPYMLEDHTDLERQVNGERPLDLPANDQPQVAIPENTTECFIGEVPAAPAFTNPTHKKPHQYMLEN